MAVIELLFPGTPKAVQSVRSCTIKNRQGAVVRTMHFQPKETVNWKGYLKFIAMQSLSQGFVPIDTAIGIRGHFVFPYTSGTSKKVLQSCREDEGLLLLKKSRPDLTDNLLKGFCDAMTGLLWTDDSRVAYEENWKVYGDTPCIRIQVVSLPDMVRERDIDDYFKLSNN